MEKENAVLGPPNGSAIKVLGRAGLIAVLLFQLSTRAIADPTPEIKISVAAGMTACSPAKVTTLDASSPPKAIQTDGWHYRFTVLLKNISDHPLKVTTESLDVSGSPDQPKQTFRLTSLGDVQIEGAPVIPPSDKLGLVELRPGEMAYVNFEFEVTHPLTKVAVTYAPEVLAEGRFGFWTGEVTSDTVSVPPPH